MSRHRPIGAARDVNPAVPCVAALVATLAILAGAWLLRATVVDASFPYFSYIDEGHVLHPARVMLDGRTWDPGLYQYPTLLQECVALATFALDRIGSALGSGSFLAEVPVRDRHVYDVIEPTQMLRVGRALVVAFSLGIVALAGFIAHRLQGWGAALLSMAALAVLPALVSRSSVVILDPVAAFFCVLAVALSLHANDAERPLPWWVGAGAASGFAFAAKYPSGAVWLVPLTVAFFDGRIGVRTRAVGVLGSGLAFGVAAFLGMPALFLKFPDVVASMGDVWEIYARKSSPFGYLDKVVRVREVGTLVLVPSVLGLLWVALGQRRIRFATGIAGFMALTLLVFLRSEAQPFRNMVPLVCVGVVFYGVPFAALRARGRAAAAVAALVAVAFLVPSLRASLAGRAERIERPDPRVQARDWLNDELRAGTTVFVTDDLAFHPSELERLYFRVSEVAREELGRVVEPGSVAVTSDRGAKRLPAGSRELVSFGTKDPPAAFTAWRGREVRVRIFRLPERRAKS